MNDNNESPQTEIERRRAENERETKQAMQLAAEAKLRDQQAGIVPPEQFVANAIKGKLEREEFQTKDGGEA